MSTVQKNAFLAGEGDHFFSRNQDKLVQLPQSGPELQLLARHVKSEHRVLEIGCGTGRNLAWLARTIGCSTHGIEPSEAAVIAGRAAFPEVELRVGSADQMPYGRGEFDVVHFGFCLCWIDRDLLLAVVAEADRVLKDGGRMSGTDFDPPTAMKRPYHHQPGLFSYKYDYSRLFLSHPAYTLVDKVAHSHAGDGFAAAPGDRLATWVLAKEHCNAFPTESLSP